MGAVIVSRLPGRLRLRAKGLRRSHINDSLCTELRGWDGVTSVEGNPRTGGILLSYDAAQVEPATMEAQVESRLADPVPVALPGEAGQTLWRMNRYAKWGMLASLTGSLLALAAGKKLHATLGAMHVVFLMVHLANHRKKLLK